MKERLGVWTPGLELGPFDLIGEYLQEHVEGRTVNGMGLRRSPTSRPTGSMLPAAYFLIPKKLQAVVQWQYLNPGQKGNDGLYSIFGRPQLLHRRGQSQS